MFAYGSLLWRPGFEYLERFRATLPGFRRVFRQASSDHRGTPERPGRVVTLVAEPAVSGCIGVVYRLAAPAARVLEELDQRERAGYERVSVSVVLADGSLLQALTWIAPPGNPHDGGETSLDELVELIAAAEGPSGRNDEYVLRLERALHELDAADPVVSEVSQRLRVSRRAS